MNGESELRADQAYPWGPESVIWVEQLPIGSSAVGFTKNTTNSNVGRDGVSRLGRIGFRMPNGKYLKFDGSLIDELNDSTLYGIEFRPGEFFVFLLSF